jgi:hypothetical protein
MPARRSQGADTIAGPRSSIAPARSFLPDHKPVARIFCCLVRHHCNSGAATPPLGGVRRWPNNCELAQSCELLSFHSLLVWLGCSERRL